MRKLCHRLSIVGLFFSLSVFAEPSSQASQESPTFDMRLEDLMDVTVKDVISAGFFKLSAAKAPGNATVITQEQIELSPSTQIRDLLDQYVTGFNIGEHESNGTLLGARGIQLDNNAKTLIMFDGQGINNRAFGYAGALEWPFYRDLKQIEVVTGPGSIQHGSGAINGFVFLEPKNGTDNQGGFGNVTYGVKEDLIQVETGVGTKFSDGHDLYMYGGWLNAHGYEPYNYGQQRTNNFDFSHGVEQERWVRGYGDPTFKIGSYYRNNGFKLNAYFINNNPQITAHPIWTFGGDTVDANSYRRQRQLAISPRYEFHIDNKNLIEIRANTEFMDQGRKNFHPRSRFPNLQKLLYGYRESHYESKLTFKSQQFEGHSIALGGLIGARKFYDDESYFGEKPDIAGGVNSEWKESAVFLEDVWQAAENLTFSAGVRWDLVDYKKVEFIDDRVGNEGIPISASPIDQSHITPRLASSYELPSLGTTVKASYQQGFHYPDALDFGEGLQINNRLKYFGFDKALAPLKPETVDSTEFGVTKEFKEARLRLNFTGYYNVYNDLLQYRCHGADELGQEVVDKFNEYFQNEEYFRCSPSNAKGGMDSLGGELSASWTPVKTLNLGFGYGYSAPRGISGMSDPNGDNLDGARNQWTHYPEHMVKAQATSFWFDKALVFHVNLVHTAAVYDIPNAEGAYDWSNPRSEVNTSLTYNFLKNFSLKAAAKNIFDEQDPKPSLRTNQPWRGNRANADGTYYVSLNYHF